MDFTKLFNDDKLLMRYENEIFRRHNDLNDIISDINKKYNSLNEFSLSHKTFGIHQVHDDVIATEYICNVIRVILVVEFSNNQSKSDKFLSNELEFCEIKKDIWQLRIENFDISQFHMVKVNLKMETNNGDTIYRVSPWSRYLVFNDEQKLLESVVYVEEDFVFENPRPTVQDGLKIYEAHVGISSCLPQVSSYVYFTNNVLPRIKNLGYDTVLLMAVMEHAYYASFGYQVTNFFAPSSRFGRPNDLKHLIDEAHRIGLRVFLDVVHSHASVNIADGLNMFNGTEEMFFHKPPRGYHPVWGTRLFNYSKLEVLQFLVSNLRMWVEDFHFDGFRFDGVTSMFYYHHGLNFQFTGEYHQYFDISVDNDAVTYLMLANHFLRSHFPFVTTICEDVSGMPTLCRPLCEGGFGFDFRLGMGIPDMWIKMMRRQRDWDVSEIVASLFNRRRNEKTVSYAESHDQAIVGDKTLAFWLMDKEMYSHMSVFSPRNSVIDDGIALHKMIRLATHCMAGEAYLNFMGNEFGHPEWLDFPRLGNKFSFHYARRQWNLVDDSSLKYKYLNNFDKKMNESESKYRWLRGDMGHVIHHCNKEKIIILHRKSCLFMFNFHPEKSYESYKVGVPCPGKYQCVLNTDDKLFGGFGRIDEGVFHFSCPQLCHDQQQHLMVYLPSKTAQMCVCVD